VSNHIKKGKHSLHCYFAIFQQWAGHCCVMIFLQLLELHVNFSLRWAVSSVKVHSWGPRHITSFGD